MSRIPATGMSTSSSVISVSTGPNSPRAPLVPPGRLRLRSRYRPRRRRRPEPSSSSSSGPPGPRLSSRSSCRLSPRLSGRSATVVTAVALRTAIVLPVADRRGRSDGCHCGCHCGCPAGCRCGSRRGCPGGCPGADRRRRAHGDYPGRADVHDARRGRAARWTPPSRTRRIRYDGSADAAASEVSSADFSPSARTSQPSRPAPRRRPGARGLGHLGGGLPGRGRTATFAAGTRVRGGAGAGALTFGDGLDQLALAHTAGAGDAESGGHRLQIGQDHALTGRLRTCATGGSGRLGRRCGLVGTLCTGLGQVGGVAHCVFFLSSDRVSSTTDGDGSPGRGAWSDRDPHSGNFGRDRRWM